MSNSLLFKGESKLLVLSLDHFFNQFIKLMMVYYQIYFDDIREKWKKNKLVGLYERAPNVLSLHVLKIKVGALSVRSSQTTRTGSHGGFCPLPVSLSVPVFLSYTRARHADDTRSFHILLYSLAI